MLWGEQAMTVQIRVAIFISSIFALLALGLYVVFNTTLMGGFLQLEDQGAHRNTARVIEGIRSLEEEVAVKAEEWGTWDDSYAYIKKRRADYEKSNLTYEALDQLSLVHFLMTDLNWKLIRGIAVDKEQEKLAALTPPTLELLSKVSARALEKGSKIAGVVEIDGKTFIVGAAPVTNSAGDAPINGVVLFSRNFDDATIKRLEELTRTTLKIGDITAIGKEFELGDSLTTAMTSGQSGTKLFPDKILGVDVVRDVFGTPIRGVVVTLSRDLLARGIEARNVVTLYVLGFTLIALATALYLLNRIVLSPLGRIGQQAKVIGEKHAEGERIEPVGDREIQELAGNINRMLDSLAEAHAEVIAARMQADAANAAKSMFIARVSHELRTPVGGIVGLNRIIKKQEGLPRAVRELVEMGDLTAHSLVSVIDEILDFAKAESGELTFESIPFDLRAIVRETMQTIAGRLEGKYQPTDKERLQLVCDIDAAVPRQVKGDPTKLRQILTNLLGNSVKFTQSGFVALRIVVDDETLGRPALRFEIADTGIGIPENKLGTIFEPFKQSDSATTRKYQGTGLGLSIVKQFTNGLGGEVSVRSVIGEGSVFSAIIPFGMEHAEASIVAVPPSRPVVLAGRSAAADALIRNLGGLLGGAVEQIEPEALVAHADFLDIVRERADLLVVLEDAFERCDAEGVLAARAADNRGCSIAVLRPSSIERRERLYGAGVKFVLTAPVLADDIVAAYGGGAKEEPVAEPVTTSTLNSLQPLSVLIVDDLPTNRIILEEMLEDAGHKVTSVGDGTDMVEKLRRLIDAVPGAEHFDIVLTDISMAVMDGDEATKAIREIERAQTGAKHVPIIAVTAHAMDDAQQKILDAGVDGIITKPINPEKVAAEFRRLLALRY